MKPQRTGHATRTTRATLWKFGEGKLYRKSDGLQRLHGGQGRGLHKIKSQSLRSVLGEGAPDLLIRESKVYSQNGEDGVIASIFKSIGTTDRFFVEIGCEDATECNTRKLSELDGWSGIRIDDGHSDLQRQLYQHTVTPENVRNLLSEHGVPESFDLFSIDVDFSDFHILRAVLEKFQPRACRLRVQFLTWASSRLRCPIYSWSILG